MPSQPWNRPRGEWLSTREACERLGVTLRLLYKLIDGGELPGYRFGRVIRLKAAEVDAYIDGQRLPRPNPTTPAVTAAARRLQAFLDACNAGEPAPCLICGELVAQVDLPAHLLEHR